MSTKSHIDVQEQVIPGVTPGALLEAMESPEQFAALARGDLYVQMAKMRQAANNPELPMNQRLEYSKFLAKMGKVEAPQHSEDPLQGLPLIKIDLGSHGSVSIGAASGPKPSPSPSEEREVGPNKPSSAVIP
jgi:hypothetical protein